ncbi:hypothetical protein LINPERPRIM_LOCUS16888 [Linum perenne]
MMAVYFGIFPHQFKHLELVLVDETSVGSSLKPESETPRRRVTTYNRVTFVEICGVAIGGGIELRLLAVMVKRSDLESEALAAIGIEGGGDDWNQGGRRRRLESAAVGIGGGGGGDWNRRRRRRRFIFVY